VHYKFIHHIYKYSWYNFIVYRMKMAVTYYIIKPTNNNITYNDIRY